MPTNALANSSALISFSLKRDRLWLPVWILAIILFAVSCAPIFPAMAGTEKEMEILAQTMKNPVMVALTGPVYGDEYTYGIMFVQTMLVWTVILIAIFNIFLVIRHTRKEEEDGRTELIRALPVGNAAGLFSTGIIVLVSNVIIAIVTGLGLVALDIEGMDAKGCILFGLAIGVCGLLFAAIAALFAQLSSTSKVATGWSVAIMGLFYLLRATGDLKNEVLSMFTPFGLAGRIQFFYQNEVWPLWILLAVAIIIFTIAFVLYAKRDLGASLIAERKGREHAKKSLNSEVALSLRLVRSTIIIWSVVILIFSASYGSVFGDLSAFYESNEFFKALLGAQGSDGKEMLISFVATIVMIMTLIAVIPVVSIIFRLRTEERKGRLESIYSRAVSKEKYLLGYYLIAVVTIIILQMLCAIGMWSAETYALTDPVGIGVIAKSVANFTPAMFFFAGLATFFVGLFPRMTGFVWIYLVYCFIMSYLGGIMDLPKAAIKASVFGIIPHYPAENFEVLPFVGVLIVGFILAIIGILAYKRRDMLSH